MSVVITQPRSEVIKLFSCSTQLDIVDINSVEHEIFNAHKYKNIKKSGLFSGQISLECYFSRS